MTKLSYPFVTSPSLGILGSLQALAEQALHFYKEIGGQAVTTNIACMGADAMLQEIHDIKMRPGSVCRKCKKLEWCEVGARVPAKCKCGGPLHPLEILYRR